MSMVPCHRCGASAPDDELMPRCSACMVGDILEEDRMAEEPTYTVVCQRGPSPLCGDCGAPMTLKVSDRWAYRNGSPKLMFTCSKAPACKGVHGAHPDGKPLGVPVDQETRTLRRMVHDKLFKNGFTHVAQHSKWLRERGFGGGHVGAMTKQECKRAIVALTHRPTQLST